ncbi:MAG: hypothetical protein ACREFV_07900 [Acetobacteraceae bacterium]
MDPAASPCDRVERVEPSPASLVQAVARRAGGTCGATETSACDYRKKSAKPIGIRRLAHERMKQAHRGD